MYLSTKYYERKMSKQQIPNPNGPKVKIGDKVKITTGEWVGYIGEVTEFVEIGGQWIKTVKLINDDGKIEYVEVRDVVLELVSILEKIGKSNVFKKFWGWFTNLFRKKGNKKPY